jgi:hypothetical protein
VLDQSPVVAAVADRLAMFVERTLYFGQQRQRVLARLASKKTSLKDICSAVTCAVVVSAGEEFEVLQVADKATIEIKVGPLINDVLAPDHLFVFESLALLFKVLEDRGKQLMTATGNEAATDEEVSACKYLVDLIKVAVGVSPYDGKSPAPFVSVTGIPADQSQCNGDYQRQLGRIVGGRPVYKHQEKKDRWMWFSLDIGQWCIGLESGVGSSTCFVSVADAASSPEHITADSWQFWNGSEWGDAKGATVSVLYPSLRDGAAGLAFTDGGGAVDICAWLVSVEDEVPNARDKLLGEILEEWKNMPELLDESTGIQEINFKQLNSSIGIKESRALFARLQEMRGRYRSKSVEFEGFSAASTATVSSANSDKYVAQRLVMGKPAEAAAGLQRMLGLTDQEVGIIMQDGLKAIRQEFERNGSEEDKRNMRYVLDQPATETEGLDKGNKGKCLGDFVQHPKAVAAGFTLPIVAGLRLYTSSSYKCVNDPLRKKQQPHPFPATTLFVHKGLMQMRQVYAHAGEAQKECEFWRGMKDLQVTDDFMEQGGTEYACMSTSMSKQIVGDFAQSEHPLIFKVTSSGFMDRGADVSWLSVYPEEAEVLYPPMTYLKPVQGSKKPIKGTNGKGWIIEVIPTLASS